MASYPQRPMAPSPRSPEPLFWRCPIYERSDFSAERAQQEDRALMLASPNRRPPRRFSPVEMRRTRSQERNLVDGQPQRPETPLVLSHMHASPRHRGPLGTPAGEGFRPKP